MCLIAKLITMKYKGKGNIKEYIMEMFNLTAKLKSLKLEIAEDLLVHLVLVSLPAHFGQFKYMQEKERLQRDKTESAHFASTSQNKKKKKIKDVAERSFSETGNARILEEVEFGKEGNIMNVVFEEECINDIGQVLVPISVQETTSIIGDNVQTIVPDIVPGQDYDEAIPQTPIEQSQQPQQVSLRRFIRERRHAILDDYIVFLQEHEDGIGLTEDDPINFCQAMQSSISQKWIDAMKDELKSMQGNDVWDLIELPEELHQMDVKTAFLNGDIDETIYMMQLENFVSNESKSMVCKLKKSIYGLKQASRQWYHKFHQVITSHGFEANILRDRSQGILRLSQENYISKVLEKFDMKDSKPRNTRIAKGDKFSLKYLSDPRMQHWKAFKCVMRYLRRTKGHMLTYQKFEDLEIIRYSDFDFAGCQDRKHSTS
ncbi:hypothetical protein CR513_19981, partial [Mucuna pruriens]